MNILDIAIAKKLAGGGGGSGTDNYNDLSNLPKINDTTLSGNKSSSALGLQSEITSDSKLASDLVDDTNQDNKFVTSTEKNTWNAKQNAIDSDHKLSSDLVDDANKTNKFVTSTEKNTWNAKQNAIDSDHKLSSDLVDDTNHTNKFVTSTEKQTWNAKQNAIDADHKLSSSLVSFTTAEAAALASGIDSTKVGQISTNQTNILYALQTGVKNVLDFANLKFKQQGSTVYTKTDTYITTTSTNNTWASTCFETELPAGTYVFSANISNLSIGSGGAPKIVLDSDAAGHGTRAATIAITQNGAINGEFTWGGGTLYILYYPNYSANAVTTTFTASNNMICTKAAWVQEPNVYRQFALPNYDLTYLQAEDRAALAEEIDAGAKNKFDISSATFDNFGNVFSITRSGSSATIKQVNPNTGLRLPGFVTKLEAGTYVLSGCPSGGGQSSYRLDVRSYSGGTVGDVISGSLDEGSGSEGFTITTAGNYFVCLRVASGYTVPTAGITVQPMICTKAAFGVSQKFVPFGNDPFYQVPINHNMIYRGRNLGATLTDAQHTALSSGNFTDLYLGDYWTKTVTIPAGTYTGGDGEEVTVPAQTNITLKAVIADFDTFYAGYASSHAGINTHHAAVIVTGFSNVVWNKTNSTAGGYVASLIHKWLVGSALPQIETWFGSAKVLSHQKLLTNAITGDAASGWAWSSQKISLLSENQMYGSKVWGNSKASNGGYEPGEAFKHLNVFNHIDTNLLFGNKNIWLRDISSAEGAALLSFNGNASGNGASDAWIAPAALILLS